MSLQVLDGSDAIARWVQLLAPSRQLAEVIAGTELVPAAIRGKPDAVTAVILYGDELGIQPMQALQGINIIDGRPQPSAELFRALILRDGHTFAIHELTGTRCRISGLRAGRPEQERVYVEWTSDMARAAGLLNRKAWREYPRAMLLARASSDLGRIVFPDVVKGLGYIAETESDAALDAFAVEVSSPVEETPVKAPRKRVARKTAATVRELDRPAVTVTEDVPGVAVVAEERPPVAPPRHAVTEAGPEDVALPVFEPEHVASEPPPESEPPPHPISARPLRALHAALGEVLGPQATREDRLSMVAAIIGKPIESTNHLTRDEGFRVLDQLDRIKEGALRWDLLDDGSIVIREIPSTEDANGELPT